MQKKYDIFIEANETGVKKYVPIHKPQERGKQDWFNTKCADAKKKRKHRKDGKEMRTKEDFKTARKEYVRIKRGKERIRKGYC